MAMNIIVCGAGQVGTTIARQLAGEGINVTVIDTNPELVRRIDESHDIRGITGHASHPEILRALRSALSRFGLNTAASRITTGNHKLYESVERAAARFFRVWATCFV